MVIQLMKERERRFHILQPGVSSVAHIAQLSAASLFIVGDTVNCLASVMAAPVPWCRLPTAGWRARDQRPSSASAHRQPRPRGRLECTGTHCSAVRPPPGPWSNMSPVPTPAQTRWVKSLSDGETLMCRLYPREAVCLL